MSSTLDPVALNITKSILHAESGGNYNSVGKAGELGGFQFTNDTWNAQAPKFGVNVPLNKATPEQQNAVAYNRILDWKTNNPTWNIGNFASAWNAGPGEPNAYTGTFSDGSPSVDKAKGFDVPSYTAKVAQAYQALKGQTPDVSQGTPSPYQASQPPSVGGFLENTVNSAGNVLDALGNAVLHPLKTVETLGSIAGGVVEKGTNALGLTNINNQDTQNFDNLVSVYGKKYGGSSIGEIVHNIGHTLYTDPVGAALDLSVVLDGAGAALGTAGKIADASKAAEIASASDFISSTKGILDSGSPEAIKVLTTPGTLTKIADAVKTAADYTNPITGAVNVAKGALGLGGQAALGIGSKIIGEDAGTLVDLVKNPQDYSKAAMDATSRGGLANEFGNAIDQIENTKSTTGSGYNAIRNSGAIVNVPTDSIVQTFADNGLKVSRDATGKWTIEAPTADTTLSSADVAHFKSFLDQFGNDQLNANQLLNARSKLSEYANYDGKTNAATSLSRDLRGTYDQLGKSQIPNLKALDEKMAPQIQAWKGIKKEFLTKDAATGEYTLKPNTASKLANALKAGKEPLVAQLEKIMPGITRKIEILKNIENIEGKMGITVGSYTKSGLEIAGVATGNIPLAVGMIIAHPAIANQILRGFGFIGKATVIPVLGRVRALLGLLPKGLIGETVKIGTDVNSAQNYTPQHK